MRIVRGLPIPPFFTRCENGTIAIATNMSHLPSLATLKKMRTALDEVINATPQEREKYNASLDKKMELLMTDIPKEIKAPKRGFIYIIKSAGLYKIGRTKSANRIKPYRTENPHAVQIVVWHSVSDYEKTEEMLLQKYKAFQYRGEWFDLKPRHVREIKSILTKIK